MSLIPSQGMGSMCSQVCDSLVNRIHVLMCFDRPQTYKELFNLRHAQARNVIERIFGVAKKCFAIIREFNEYPMTTQARISPACCAVHNFIHTHDPDDNPEPWVSPDGDGEGSQVPGTLGCSGAIGPAETHQATQKREQIAHEILKILDT